MYFKYKELKHVSLNPCLILIVVWLQIQIIDHLARNKLAGFNYVQIEEQANLQLIVSVYPSRVQKSGFHYISK